MHHCYFKLFGFLCILIGLSSNISAMQSERIDCDCHSPEDLTSCEVLWARDLVPTDADSSATQVLPGQNPSVVMEDIDLEHGVSFQHHTQNIPAQTYQVVATRQQQPGYICGMKISAQCVCCCTLLSAFVTTGVVAILVMAH